jgi:hypothetical protein
LASLDYFLIEKLKQLGKSVRFQGYQVKMATAPNVEGLKKIKDV